MTENQDKTSFRNQKFAPFWRNPVLVKELRGRMRGKRTFILLTLYLSFLTLLVLLIYLLFASSGSNMLIANQRQVFSKTLYWVIFGVQMITIAFVGPGLTGGSISGERERQTYDLLKTSLLPASKLVFGKYLSGIVFLFLLIISALPIQSLSFLLGGVAAQEIFLGTSILVVVALSICAAGMLFSSFTSRSLVSTVLSYGFAVINLFGFPLLLLILFGLLRSTSLSNLERLSTSGQALLLSLGWVLVSLNPVAATVVSEVIFIEEHSLTSIALPLSNNTTINLISPWIPFSIAFLLLSGLLIWISVKKVEKPEV